MKLVTKADSFGWWNKEDEGNKKDGKDKVCDQMIKAIESDKLILGVIGQMKCGKSTFLNAFVFGKEILPAATTPMTAALTIITYGQSEKMVAEFYNSEEWAEQKQIASLDIEEFAGDSVQQSKIKAAKELVSQSQKLGNDINLYLGKTQTDTLDSLIQYVGADGKYVSITKSVKIEYPADYLKGVEIVDTPGFNDPIQSREERTKDFLKRADAVLMMLYANQPFSQEDNAILFDNVRKCGVGKVLVAVNKYDLPLSNGETEKEMTDYVKGQLELAIENCGDSMIGRAFGDDVSPVCISAQMELLSQLSMSEISKEEDKKFHLDKYYKDFGISSQQKLHEISNFDKMVAKIKKMLSEDKTEILFRKPVSRVLQTGELIKNQVKLELSQQNVILTNCNKPDEQLEEEMDAINKVIKKANRKIEGLGGELDNNVDGVLRKGKRDLEDLLDSAVRKMNKRIDDWGVFQNSSKDKLERDLKSAQEFFERDAVYKVEEIEKSVKLALNKTSRDFVDDLSDIIVDKLEDFDTDDIVSALKKAFVFEDFQKKSSNANYKEDELIPRGMANALITVGTGLVGLGIKTGIDFLRHEGKQQKYRDKVDEFKKSFNPESFLSQLSSRKNEVIENAKRITIENCLQPLQDSLQKIIDNKADREKLKQQTEAKVNALNVDLKKIERELAEINEIEIVKRFRVA